MTTERPTCETGEYRDHQGCVWFCVVSGDRVHCNTFGQFTCADHNTFRRWGWRFLNRGEHKPGDEG